MSQIGGKDAKRHFTVVMGGKEHGLYVSSTPSSAARKAVTKLCTANKSKKVEFSIREITQGSKKKTYGPYEGHIEKLKEPIELKGRVIKYKPVAKLSGKKGVMKGGDLHLGELKSKHFLVESSKRDNYESIDHTYKYDKSLFGKDKLFFGPIFSHQGENGKERYYFPYVLFSDSWFYELYELDGKLNIKTGYFNSLDKEPYYSYIPKPDYKKFSKDMNKYLKEISESGERRIYLSRYNRQNNR